MTVHELINALFAIAAKEATHLETPVYFDSDDGPVAVVGAEYSRDSGVFLLTKNPS
jgi:hypothetical protein